MTTYLQSLQGVVLRLSGLSRGADRALRVSDGSASTGTATSSVAQASIKTGHLADRSVTSSKIADGAITEAKFGISSVTTKAIKAGSITEESLAALSVTRSKLSGGIMPSICAGVATDGEEVTLPAVYSEKPLVMLAAITVVVAGSVGVQGLREVMNDDGYGTGVWKFDALGGFEWAAIGYENE